MSNKKTVLINVSYLAEVSEDELNAEDGNLDRLIDNLSDVSDSVVSPVEFEWNSSQMILLDSNEMNCGKCASCGEMTTGREAPEHISQLCNGARIDGKLYCDECLPEDHHWAF